MAGNEIDADDSVLRRDRLELLKARRQSLVDPSQEHSFSINQTAPRAWVNSDGNDDLQATAPATVTAAAVAAPAKSNLLINLMSGKLQGGKAARAQIMAKAMQVLTRTPLDADGMIAGTPYSSAGLTLLVQMLRTRAEAANATGSKAVKTVLTFLQATPGEAATPQGLSLSKLQMIAQRLGGAGQGKSTAPPAGLPTAPARPGPAAGAHAGASAAQRQMMAKLHYMLTNTPADARGLVSGTGFTAAGVARLMALLHQRAANPGLQGGKMALRLLDSLAATAGETDVIDGASLQKLRALATRLTGAV